ncbi:hypothetical protein [Stenotrophomonas bentonitica]|uniref:hypothetical protein n=1 Tax=Stenotrophomonas bentonitica TaxID=1450134 RepID=UPI0031BADF0E
MNNVAQTAGRVKPRGTGLSHDDLKTLAMELSAALPPVEVLTSAEQELLSLYRLMDEGRQAATRNYLAAMA